MRRMTPFDIKIMSASEVAKHLAEHNKWRRGIGKYAKAGSRSPHNPIKLGMLIDRAEVILKEIK